MIVIHIDSSDELNTLVNRIRSSDETQVILVLPEKYPVLANEINMRLLAKYVAEMKKDVIIQTNDQAITKLAEEIGIQIKPRETEDEIPYEIVEYEEVLETANETERKTARVRRSRAKQRLGVLLFIILASLAIVYLTTPQALVVVTPSYLPFSETITFRFDSLHGIDTVSAKTSITRRTSSTGRETIGLSKAQGVVVLLNQQQKEVRVPKGTILKTGNGVSFETLKDVVVPAVSTQYFMDVPTGLQAGKAEVAVRALESGASGNVAAGRISLVEGFNLDVRNPEPTNGGEDLVKMFVTEPDLARAKELVLKDARQLALETLYQTIKNGLVLDDTLLVNIEWKEGSTAGEEGPEAYVSAIAHGQISRADTERLSAQIIDVLNEIISPGFEVVPATIKVIETTVTNDNGEYNLKVKVEGYCQGLVEEVLLKDLLLGREVEEVANVCASLPHIAEIAVVEAKRDRLPRWSNWVRLEIQQPY